MNAPLYLARSGLISNGSLNYVSGSYYWSSTLYDQETTRGLYFYSGRIDPENGNLRYNGISLRCVLLEP